MPSGGLRYLELHSGSRSFVGLLDSGAELCAIGSSLLKRLPHRRIEGPVKVVEGFGSVPLPVESWAVVTAYIAGQRVEFTCAEFPELRHGLVLGLPFFEAYRLAPDFASGVCASSLGRPLEILSGTRTSTANACKLRLPTPSVLSFALHSSPHRSRQTNADALPSSSSSFVTYGFTTAAELRVSSATRSR